MRLLNKVAVLACACSVGLAYEASAIPLSIGDGNELGFVNFGIPTGDSDIPQYVSAMIGLGLGGSTTVTIGPKVNTVTRSMNPFSPLDPVSLISHTATSSGALTIPSGGAEYLFAKYDGPNFGSEVWYIAGLSGSITIPDFAGQYGLSGVAFLTPDTTGHHEPPPVPDGGATLALLGFGLLGLGGLRKMIRQA